MKHRFQLQIRLLVEQFPDVHKIHALETGFIVTTKDGWECGAAILRDGIRLQCEQRRESLREAPDWMAVAWSEAKLDEETAVNCGVCYHGPLARSIKVVAERDLGVG